MSTANALQSPAVYEVRDPSFRIAVGSNLSALLIVACDALAIIFVLSAFLAPGLIGHHAPGTAALAPIVVIFFLLLNWCFDLYPGVSISPVDEIRSACLANSVGFVFVWVAFGFRRNGLEAAAVCLPAFLCAAVLSLVMRAGLRRFGSRFGWWGHPVAIFGGGDVARSLLRKLKRHPHLGLRPVAVFTNNEFDQEVEGISAYRIQHLPKIAAAGVKHIVVAAPELSQSDFNTVVGIGCDAFPHLIVIREADPVWKVGSYTQELAGVLGIRVGNNLLSNSSRLAKRTMDLTLSVLLTLFLLPIIAGICALVILDAGFPVFYSQERLGRGGQSFRIWKFRTMARNSTDILERYLATNPELRGEWVKTHKLRDDPRITRIGKILRRTSLDELPQLWNVINGDMSLVGPRPIVEAEVEKYHRHFSTYIKTSPGMTGLWQVSGRNHTTYKERVALDAYYVHNWSVWMDIYLLCKTFLVVLTGHGAY